MTNLKAQMIRLGLTVRDVALICGLTTRAVELWRAGTRPTPQALTLLLTALEEQRIDIAWLLSKLGKQHSNYAEKNH